MCEFSLRVDLSRDIEVLLLIQDSGQSRDWQELGVRMIRKSDLGPIPSMSLEGYMGEGNSSEPPA